MKVLIVAKTRRGAGACVGGITDDGKSVRFIAHDAAANERAGLEYEPGQVWDVEAEPDPGIRPPHVENIIVKHARFLRTSQKVEEAIRRFMPPVTGGPEKLFDGLLQNTSSGALYIAERCGLPARSTMFWVPGAPLARQTSGKRIRYRYLSPEHNGTLTFVGFQEPIEEIPAGTLVRVSLAHWWQPKDRPGDEPRCFLQLSGWFLHGSREEREPRKEVNTTGRLPVTGEPPALPEAAFEILSREFGFAGFLPTQAEVVRRVLSRRDTLAVMPTGGGKSLCYQLPALLFGNLTVVVSPLVALMQDQDRQLQDIGVPAACLNHMVSMHEYVAITDRVRKGAVRILYVAPETLRRPETLLLLEDSRLTCLAVDEAHCISEWGHDFRPEYRRIAEVRGRFPDAVCLALTATATPRVRKDIRQTLGIPPEGELVSGFDRPNLFLACEPRSPGLTRVLEFLNEHREEPGIIYCGTRKQADELSAALAGQGWKALPYHAGLEDDVRRRNQESFFNGDARLMVATIAFGMGINKSDIRFVLHYHLPRDVESYFQEIGRAGRDGLPAHCLLLHGRSDAIVHEHFIREGTEPERRGRQERLHAILRYSEATGCRRIPLLGYFGEEAGGACGHCDNCAGEPAKGEKRDITPLAEKYLLCVKETGQIYGSGHIIGVLRGSRSSRILERQHDRLCSHGAGKEHSEEEWRELARHILRQGLVKQDIEYGGICLTPRGRDVLEKKETVQIPAAALSTAVAGSTAMPEPDTELLRRLMTHRRELASRACVPAYIVFSDRTLGEMAARFPQDEAQLVRIHGVGQAKLAKYGASFLEVIRGYCQERGVLPPSVPAAAPVQGTAASKRYRFEEAGELFREGTPLEEIAKRFGHTVETTLQHLYRFLESGRSIDPERVLLLSGLDPSERARVFGAFEALGVDRLTPVHDALSGAVSYRELHVLRLYLLCRKKQEQTENPL